MKKLLASLFALALLPPLARAQTDLMIYESFYAGCVDDEMSPIYGGNYCDYPPDLVDAKFPGGDVEMSMYIHQNTEMPNVLSGEKDVDGTPLLITGDVKVQIVVDRCGRTCCYEILQSLSPEQDAAAIEVVRSLPVFRPATLDGYRVKSAYVVPVKFNRRRYKAPEPEPEPEPSYDDYYYW